MAIVIRIWQSNNIIAIDMNFYLEVVIPLGITNDHISKTLSL